MVDWYSILGYGMDSVSNQCIIEELDIIKKIYLIISGMSFFVALMALAAITQIGYPIDIYSTLMLKYIALALATFFGIEIGTVSFIEYYRRRFPKK